MNKGTPSYKYYSSINELPLRQYKDALIRGNLNALVIDGDPPMDELVIAFDDIKQEYADEVGDSEYLNYIKTLKEITLLNVNHQQVHIAVQNLGTVIPLHFLNPDDPDFLGAITAYRAALMELIGMDFDFTDPDNYESYLKRCINRSAGIKIELDLKKANFEAIQQKFENAKLPDDHYFNSILITLSDSAGYHLTDAITVFEFVNRLKRLMKPAKVAK